MKISVLADNHAGAFTRAEHGLSYLVEHDQRKILLDTGQSSLFAENASVMKINLEDIDTIVLSHGHFDHGDGLDNLEGKKLICHPGCFVQRYRKQDNTYIGLKLSKEELEQRFSLITAEEPYRISEGSWFLGYIPRITDFESQRTTFIFKDGSPDFVDDDSAMALMLDEGLFIVTGCGHAGIVNTIEHALKVTGGNKIAGVMGGFHLKTDDRQTIETIKYLKENRVKYVMPSHCTELPALASFYNEFGIRQVKTGDVFEI
ncbi:MAG: MBL fold metallo-hydrolase [Bacteroidales bacterium]|nr:MBL fold metallo-hydrolase [Bacteroidales bacterium]MBN2633335.1 MBL fold metallo-hydrolase [Bacteroidales bacterium]